MTLYPAVFSYFLRFCLKVLLRFYLKIRHRVEEDIPPGPKVFAVNHPTVWDAFPILALVHQTFVRTLVEDQIWSFLVPRIIFRLGNQIVLHRSEESLQTIRDAMYVLSKGDAVLIAPEGERTDPAVKVRARRGVARLAIAARAAVIPVGAWISKDDIVMKKVHYRFKMRRYSVDSYFPRFRCSYGLVIGRPMHFDAYFDRELSLDEYQDIASAILDRIYELSEKARKLVQRTERTL
ncbi:MAG: 1-acyl-sn-glycerol-3-phosphate acyltransferase [Spirochaetaceae bacterium]|nr:MAG: 1-acyl-sn-glycerol-3-phosphate acyltransferase [Spirochaetaceae bacterium]